MAIFGSFWFSSFRLSTVINKSKLKFIDFSRCANIFLTFESEGKSFSCSSRNNNDNKMDKNDIKISILDASLDYVLQYGWSRRAIAAGAEKVGYSGVAHGLFPEGGIELVYHFYSTSNQSLEDQLKINKIAKNNQDLFLRNVLETRLRMIIPYLDKWPQAIAMMTMPQNAPQSLVNLMDLVDTVWFYANDSSIDFSWYKKRCALAVIYKSTELCLIQDSSPEYNTTWLFLDRRIADFVNMKKYIYQMQDNKEIASDLLLGGIYMVRNILGFGRQNR